VAGGITNGKRKLRVSDGGVRSLQYYRETYPIWEGFRSLGTANSPVNQQTSSKKEQKRMQRFADLLVILPSPMI
jgi:hypothetical protein